MYALMRPAFTTPSLPHFRRLRTDRRPLKLPARRPAAMSTARPTRRAATIAFALGAAGAFLPHSTAAPALRTLSSTDLRMALTFPAQWFVSERAGRVVVGNLADVVVATVLSRRIRLQEGSDPYSLAYELVRDRVEQEGAFVSIKDARRDTGALRFVFDVETAMPDGSTIVRHGIGAGIPSADGASTLSCILTAPMPDWARLSNISEAVVSSLKPL